jgi:hypothetical protein
MFRGGGKSGVVIHDRKFGLSFDDAVMYEKNE